MRFPLTARQAGLHRPELHARSRPAAMIRPPTRTHEHLSSFNSCCCLQAAASGPPFISRVPVLCPSPMIDEAQRARMIRNREEALRRLHIRRSMMNKTDCEISGVCVQSGGQLTGSTGIVDSRIPQKVSTSFSTLGNSQETKRMQTDDMTRNKSIDLQNFQNVKHADAHKGQSLVAPTNITQELDYVVVIDFEATCDKNMENVTPQEIIEFPSVLVNCHGLKLEAFFQTYVKPVRHPILTEFCMQLTGIQQKQVDSGVGLIEALDKHDRWLEEKGVKDKNFAILIWSDWDCKVMLESECRWKGLKKPSYFNRWINLKLLFQNVFLGRKCNLRKSVEVAGLKWTGRAHCGLDDATNTARLALELMRRGTILTVTGSLSHADESPPVFVKIRRPQLPSTDLQVALRGNESKSSSGTASRSAVEVKESVLCFCGVRSRKRMVKKPGPTYGRLFFACGKWTMTDGDQCNFFQWVVS